MCRSRANVGLGAVSGNVCPVPELHIGISFSNRLVPPLTIGPAMPTWSDKWTGILSKLDSCVAECRAHLRSSQKCRDSIEAVIADLWHLKDLFESDPAVSIPRSDLNGFPETPGAFNIRGCGDLATLDKHFIVKKQTPRQHNPSARQCHRAE